MQQIKEATPLKTKLTLTEVRNIRKACDFIKNNVKTGLELEQKDHTSLKSNIQKSLLIIINK